MPLRYLAATFLGLGHQPLRRIKQLADAALRELLRRQAVACARIKAHNPCATGRIGANKRPDPEGENGNWMETELVCYETHYPAAVITLNCPQTRNALSMRMVDAVMAALRRAQDDSSVRALIVTGVESAFSAGMDLRELRRALDEMKFDKNGGALWAGAFRGEELVDRLLEFPGAVRSVRPCAWRGDVGFAASGRQGRRFALQSFHKAA